LLETHVELKLEEILSHIFLAPPTAQRIFQKLQRMGVLTRTTSGAVRISDTHTTRRVEIVAVEFKLRRWKDALAQAITYQKFADRSYVVLDEDQVTVGPQMDFAFRAAAVGLILQREAALRVLIEPTAKAQISSDRVVAVQKLASAFLDRAGTSN
jgi:hypothetical protein